METAVGASLREARKRRELDLTEVEAAIKIRVRYLEAIEAEDWGALPDEVYARSFIRTYASHLGLDGERLAEQYRESTGGDRRDREVRRVQPVGSAVPARSRPGGRALAGLAVLALGGLLLAVGLTGDDGERGPTADDSPLGGDRAAGQPEQATVATRSGVALGLAASGEVWVCVLDAGGRPVVDGEILGPGEEVGPFRSQRFSAAFGNGAVALTVNGRPAPIPDSSGPVGYEIDAEGDLTSLEEGERPDCE